MAKSVIDCDYLAEMRTWVGEEVFAALVRQAAGNLSAPMAELTAAWRRSDRAGFRDGAHRLKGAAASIGCVALARAAVPFLDDVRPVDAVSGAEMQALQTLLQASVQALEIFAAQPQETPVPASPQ